MHLIIEFLCVPINLGVQFRYSVNGKSPFKYDEGHRDMQKV